MRGGGSLTLDLAALLGPSHMHAGHTPCCRKELYYLGEAPRGGEGGGPCGLPGGPLFCGGLYLSLPAPFFHSARITLRWTGGEGDWAAAPWQEGASEAGASEGAEACWTVAARGGSGGLAEGAAGYLQGAVREFNAEPGMARNVLVEVERQRGTFMMLSLHVEAETKNFVEGDVRAWTDHDPTPALWDSGFEDFFEGSHGYERVHHSCGEHFFSWDRAEPINWDGGCPPDHPPCPIHFFQIRALLHDALPFRDSLRVALEGHVGSHAGRMRAGALWYGSPTRGLFSSDWLRPGDELAAGGSGRYRVDASTADVQEYAHSSSIPSLGEIIWGAVESQEIGWPAGGAVPSQGGARLSVPAVLRLAPGARVAFSLRIEPSARAVYLRRLVDTRVGVQLANVWANGVALGQWLSTDRHFSHLVEGSWKVEALKLPRAATAGRSWLNMTLLVLHDDLDGARVYPPFHHGPGWTEAQWEVLCDV